MNNPDLYPKVPEKYRFEWVPAQSESEPFDHLHPVLNHTKWDELRLAMYDLSCHVSFRCKILGTHWITEWDSEWYYHFRSGGYVTTQSGDRFIFVYRPAGTYKYIEWTELHFTLQDQPIVLAALANLSMPYELSDNGLKVFGYIDDTGRLTVTRS